jgi:cytochrome oxidase Cu insertion factor (SCO1/SenC/PrrC family)
MFHSIVSSRAATAVLLCLAVFGPAGTHARADTGVRLADLPKIWRDDDGREFPLARLQGQRVILTMAYTSCHDFCPATIALLRQVQRTLDSRGEQAQIVVVGYDPENDDPASWHRYRISRHLSRPNWHFLTGSPHDTERLARALGFDFWKYDEHVMHESRVLVFDSAGTQQAHFGPRTRNWAADL